MADADLLKKFGFKEEVDIVSRNPSTGHFYYDKTGFPEPINRFRFIREDWNLSIEASYFWLLQHSRIDLAYPIIDKITDVFAASEQSAFFGVAQQRLGLQQDKVSQFLATIGKMVKELFQLVRELRIIDERLELYRRSYKGDEAAEISLKGYWIDLVEGGAKNPASVYGMSRELGFTTLPDVFFSTHPISSENVDEVVDSLKFNRKLKEVLKRKLKIYLVWKEHTHKELQVRRRFTIKYLRQHYDIIRMYMTWVKPYLRNIRRLQLQDRTESVDLMNAFEGSLVEIEILLRKPVPDTLLEKTSERVKAPCYACILLTFQFRTRPAMSYVQEGYQRGPIHVGRMHIMIRGYAWTDDQIKKFKQMREEEDLDLLKTIDESVKEAMIALGDELKAYLTEGGEIFTHEWPKAIEKKKQPKQESIIAPFTSVVKGFGELTALPFPKKIKGKKVSQYYLKKNIKTAQKTIRRDMWVLYKNYRKAHRMLAW